MKLLLFGIVFLLLFGGMSLAHSQSVRPDRLPKSFTYSSQSKPLTDEHAIETMVLPVPNVDSVLRIEQELDAKGITRPFRFGINIPISFSMTDHGTIDELENGGRLWRMKFICPGAHSVNFMLRRFTSISGMFLYTYNSQKNAIDGPWYDINTRAGKRLGIFPVTGNTATVEVYLPPNAGTNAELIFESVIYGFRQTDFAEPQTLKKKNTIQSTDCQRDVNCSEGDDWCRQKYSVALVLLESGLAWCSGSLLNNMMENFTPYFLTAFHCLDGTHGNGTLTETEKTQVADWSFKFGRINEVCQVNGLLPSYNYSGATFKAAWNGTDFALLQLIQQPVSGTPNFPDVYFNGWDKSGAIPDNTISLHHPEGRAMKIAVDNDPPTICGDMRAYTDISQCNATSPSGTEFWRIYPDVGALQDGSSGAPLFDPVGRVIGQVSHGCNPCNDDHNEKFGRFAESWVGGGHDDDGLRHWLDEFGILSGDVLNGIHLDNLEYGYTYSGTGAQYHNAYDGMRVGSGDNGLGGVNWWTVTSGVTLDVKAGRSIRVLPCSRIASGSETRLFIANSTCSDVVLNSDPESKYEECTISGINHEHQEKRTIHDTSLAFNGLSNGTLEVIPNPSDGMITIRYSIQVTGKVQVNIFNLFGQRISTVFEGEQAQGMHALKFDVSDQGSGVYFVQLRTPTGVITKSMVVSR